MLLPTASTLDRADACPASFTLPRIAETSDDANAGTVIHSYVEAARVDPVAALAAVPLDMRDRCEAIDLSVLPAGLESEVAFGWNPKTGEVVRYHLDGHRRYPDDGLLHGTADLVGFAGGRAIVLDIKTGSAARASESLQLADLGLCAARYAGAEEADVGMLCLRSDGSWWVDRHTLDTFALLETEERLRSILRRVEAARGETVPTFAIGDHCTYCPASTYCPAQTAIVRQVASWEVETIEQRITALSLDEAGAAWTMVALVLDRAEAAKKVLQARARREPLPVAPGKVLAEVPWSTTKKSEVAKAECAALDERLRERGEIQKCATTQVRVVNAPKRKP